MEMEVYDQTELYAETDDEAYEMFANQFGISSYGPGYYGLTSKHGTWARLYDKDNRDYNDEYYVHLSTFAKETEDEKTHYVVDVIRIKTDNRSNYKVTNIINNAICEARTASK